MGVREPPGPLLNAAPRPPLGPRPGQATGGQPCLLSLVDAGPSVKSAGTARRQPCGQRVAAIVKKLSSRRCSNCAKTHVLIAHAY